MYKRIVDRIKLYIHNKIEQYRLAERLALYKAYRYAKIADKINLAMIGDHRLAERLNRIAMRAAR